MKNTTYFTTTAILFVVVALLHFVRVAFGLDLWIGGYEVPAWLSWVAVAFTGFLAYHGFRFNRKNRSLLQ